MADPLILDAEASRDAVVRQVALLDGGFRTTALHKQLATAKDAVAQLTTLVDATVLDRKAGIIMERCAPRRRRGPERAIQAA